MARYLEAPGAARTAAVDKLAAAVVVAAARVGLLLPRSFLR